MALMLLGHVSGFLIHFLLMPHVGILGSEPHGRVPAAFATLALLGFLEFQLVRSQATDRIYFRGWIPRDDPRFASGQFGYGALAGFLLSVGLQSL